MSASAGRVSGLSSLVPTWISISGWAAVNSLSRGTKYSLPKNGCTDILTGVGTAPCL